MTKSKSIAARGPSGQATMVPATVQEDLFGPPPLILGEDPAVYEALLGRVSAGVEPRGILEEVWVRDVVDLLWDTLRWRRLKASLLLAESHEGVEFAMKPLWGWEHAERMSKDWARGDKAETNGHLSVAGLTEDSVMALTLDRKLDQVERIDRLLASAEARRNNALREIDRHRAAAVRAVVEEVEDAEFTDVETGETVGVPQ